MQWRHSVLPLWIVALFLGRFIVCIRHTNNVSAFTGTPTRRRDLSSLGAHASSTHQRGSAGHLLHAVRAKLLQQNVVAVAGTGPAIDGSEAQDLHSSLSRRAKLPSISADGSSLLRQQRRSLTQRNSMQLWDVPGDPTVTDVVSQSLGPLLSLLPFSPFSSVYAQPSAGPGGDTSSGSTDGDTSMRSFNHQSKGPAQLSIYVVFVPVGNANNSLRLPLPPRHFYVALTGSDSANMSQGSCGGVHVYKDQTINCPGLVAGNYTVALFDADDENLLLAQIDTAVAPEGASTQIHVQLGLLRLEASFNSLSWGGQYYPQQRTDSGPVAIHAQIVGAQIVMYSQARPDVIWDMQWTDDAGTANFFIPPDSQQFIANMSIGDTLLASSQVSFSSSLVSPSLALEPQMLQLEAEPQLLCTGEVESVRGDSGQLPFSVISADSTKPLIYHPRGFFCRWELLPDYPELTLTVNYADLLEDESITLYLGPNNVIKLQRPGQPTAGGIFQTSVWVDRSIFVEFRTTRGSTFEVGHFSLSWASSSPSNRSLMGSRNMVVVLVCVSAAGAVLAAFCFYCMCCSRRWRGAVVVDGTAAAQGVNLLRVSSAVRELLPNKPYQPPEAGNTLPGASTEPDCCSICLVEFKAQEDVTVLPCMHFYHKECINSWLKRNCTCPLCKANVLHAFSTAAIGPQQRQPRMSIRQLRLQVEAAAAAAAGSSTSSGISYNASGISRPQQAVVDETAGAALASAQDTEMVRAMPTLAVGTASAWHTGNLHEAQSAAAAALPGDAVVSVSAVFRSPADRQGRLPALQHHVPLSGLTAAGGTTTPKSSRRSREGQLPVAGNGNSTVEQLSSHAYPTAGAEGVPHSAAAALALQSGTVHASSADFAAAAAAVLASTAHNEVEVSPEHSGHSNAVQAARRAAATVVWPSRVWGQLHGLLRGANSSTPNEMVAAAADASNSQQSHEVEMHVPTGNYSSARGRAADAFSHSEHGSRTSTGTPELRSGSLLPPAGRAAVSIYAYAGHLQPAECAQGDTVSGIEDAVQEQLQHAEVQQPYQQGLAAVLGLGMQDAGSSRHDIDHNAAHAHGSSRCLVPGAIQQ